jgi:hypothetical protein
MELLNSLTHHPVLVFALSYGLFSATKWCFQTFNKFK